jgi:hypothetical protein
MYLIGLHRIGMHLIDVCLMGLLFIGMHLIRVHLIGSHRKGMHLIRVSHRLVPHTCLRDIRRRGCTSGRCTSTRFSLPVNMYEVMGNLAYYSPYYNDNRVVPPGTSRDKWSLRASAWISS